MEKKIRKYLVKILASLIIVWIAQLLWNYFAPMFNIVTLSYWQMWGLYILTNILIKPTVQLSQIIRNFEDSDD